MFAKLNHCAIVSDRYAAQGVFYKALFDLKSGSTAQFEAGAFAIGDGYVGMNINARVAGRQQGCTQTHAVLDGGRAVEVGACLAS